MTDYVRRSRPRARTIREGLDDEPELAPDPDIATPDERPRTRAECVGGARPCPWIACRHHLALDVDPVTGSIKLNHPDREPWDLAETCSLDVADRGETEVRAIGDMINVSRARVDQIIGMGMRALKRQRRIPRW